MEGLLKRISAEGSEAENALRVVAFFDELVGHRSALDALVRSTARLIGAPAGYESQSRGTSWSFDSIGRPFGTSIPQGARSQPVSVERGFSGVVWILPDTSNHVLADLVLERMALSAAIVLGRDTGEGIHAEETSLSRLLDSRNSADDRRLDAQLLGFRSSWKARVVVAGRRSEARLAEQLLVWSRSAEVRVTTPIADGEVCFAMIHDTGELDLAELASPDCLVGLGSTEPVEDAYRSLETARLAYRLCSPELGPTHVDYTTIGPLRFLASVSPAEALADETVRQLTVLLDSESGRAELLALDAFCRNTSLRTAAVELNLHHSSLANRLENVARKIGRDLGDPRQRLLLAMSLQLLRVARSV